MRAEIRDEPCRTALNRVRGMPFPWSLNPYMGCAHRCTFCYVRAFERRADRPADARYGASVRVKSNIAEVLARELRHPRWQRELVVIGAATDPYQPIEGRWRLTRACLETLASHANPMGLITRGPLVVRDVDVLASASRRARVKVNVSIPTLDPGLAARTEVGVAPPRARLAAVARLAEAGVHVVVAIAPLIPGLTDAPEAVTDVVRAAREHGAAGVWPSLLYLQPGTREHFLEATARAWPREGARLAQLYGSRAHLPRAASQPVVRRVREAWEEAPPRTDLARIVPEPCEPPRFAQQLGLGLV